MKRDPDALIWWTSAAELTREGAPFHYEVVKYSDRIRKQAALCRVEKGVGTRFIAWFPNESDAIVFCLDILNGIQHAGAS